MCGIFAVLDITEGVAEMRRKALYASRLLRHRGPDWSGIWNDDSAILAHERLSIVDVETGHQPLVDPASGIVLAANGEIYNHEKLRAQLRDEHDFHTRSDCEVITALYRRHGHRMFDVLEGMFAFVLYSPREQRYLVARDHVGIIPLYYGRDADGRLLVASELKALVHLCTRVEEFPPGHYLDSATGELVSYYRPAWANADQARARVSPRDIRAALERSVESHLMSDVPFGVLLSGGLDSSIISAVAARLVGERAQGLPGGGGRGGRLRSFAVGLEGSPDLVAAQKVADAIGSDHESVHFTVREGIDAVSDVIYTLETYDLTTVRASTPMYLMARRIKSRGIKMVLSGEGSDEIFAGYLYFHNAPNARELQEECIRKIRRLHLFDCLRANKSMAAWGVEVRVPFLDRRFLDFAMAVDPELKMCGRGKIEKRILREAFEGALPPEILWRQKEQFSDGVGYLWIDSLKAYAEREISDAMFADAARRFPVNTPDTKEGYLYRSIFEGHFPHADAVSCVPSGKSIACSTPEALRWGHGAAALADPSGRSVRGVHASAYQ